jgi:alkanesulfonate monooxygenase SsuD/methylene tetrahydromethanopterin reductase-like flavin-dependent oxidoreductase (luciferase family)
MDVGVQMVFASYGWDNIGDAQVWDEELRLARLADELGFDVLWSVEHHFFDYSFCPDNLQLMSYLAGVTSHADLGTAAVILPWHDPLRVAEQVAILDHLAKGRFRFGIGRGLARREFAAFRGTMDQSRERFDEAAPMIIEALRTGFIEGHGKHYKQPRIAIRPRPERSFDDRIYAVASSEDSVEASARLKTRMVMFADRPWPMRAPQIERHRTLFREFHHAEAPPFLIADFCVCTPTMDGAEDLARRHMGSFVDSNLEHYEILSGHFATTKGYDAYAKKAEMRRRPGATAWSRRSCAPPSGAPRTASCAKSRRAAPRSASSNCAPASALARRRTNWPNARCASTPGRCCRCSRAGARRKPLRRSDRRGAEVLGPFSHQPYAK